MNFKTCKNCGKEWMTIGKYDIFELSNYCSEACAKGKKK